MTSPAKSTRHSSDYVLCDAKSGTQSELARILDDYFNQLERGIPPHRHTVLAAYPHLAESLGPYLDSLELLRSAAVALRPENAAGNPPQDAARPFSSPEGGSELGCLGDFRLRRELGRGGMGIVYEAEQVSLSRNVALKVLPFAGALQETQLRRFRNEALAAAQLDHPNIVHIHSVGHDRGVHFYAMQLIDGVSLAEVVHQLRHESQPSRSAAGAEPASCNNVNSAPETPTAPLTSTITDVTTKLPLASSIEYARTVARLGIQAAEAIHFAHEQGIIHRDIKPSNLLIDTSGKLWVTDFGLARFRSELTHLTATGYVIGTLSYMSPEQLDGTPGTVDGRTDVYALGATLYELLTLRLPFECTDRQVLMRQVSEAEPTPLRSHNGGIPFELETIVLKAMAKSPSARYATAKSLADDLRRFLDHLPILARRPSAASRLQKWAHRNRTAVTATSITAVVAVLLGFIALWRERNVALSERNRAVLLQGIAEGNALVAQRHLYAADLALAYEAWKGGNTQLTLELLNRHRPAAGQTDVRGFAWHHLRHLVSSMARVLRGHSGEVYFVRFSTDCRTLASASADGTVRIWETATGQQTLVLRGHAGEVNCVTVSPNARRLVTASNDRTAKVWDAHTGRVVTAVPQQPEMLVSACYTPDGQNLVTIDRGGMVTLWDDAEETAKKISSFDTSDDSIHAFDGTRDGRLAATGDTNHKLRVWEFPSGRLLSETTRHEAIVRAVAFSPDGQTLVSGGEDGKVRIWTIANGLHEEGSLNTGPPQSVRFYPDGRLLAVGTDDGVVTVWDWANRKCVNTFRGNQSRVWCVDFGDNGRVIASCGADETVRLWRMAGDTTLETHWRRENVNSFAADVPRSRIIISDDADYPEIREVAAAYYHKSLMGPRGEAGKMLVQHVDSTGRFVAGHIPNWVGAAIWDLESDQFQCKIPGERAGRLFGFTPDGGSLITSGNADSSRSVFLWDARTGSLQHEFSGNREKVQAAAAAPDRSELVTIAIPDEVAVWDLKSFQRRMRFTTEFGEPSSVAVSQQKGSGVFFGRDLNDVAKGQSNTSASLIAIGGLAGIEIRDAETGVLVHRLLGHVGRVNALSFSPDGTTLTSAANDGTIRLWDLATGRDLASFNLGFFQRAELHFNAASTLLVGCFLFPHGELHVVHWRAEPRSEVSE